MSDAKEELRRIIKEEEEEQQRQEAREAHRKRMEALLDEDRQRRKAEEEAKEKRRKAEMEEAIKSGKLTLNDPSLTEHERHEVRQYLQRAQEEREAAIRKAAEKSPFEKLLDRHKAAKELLEATPTGDPHFNTFIKRILTEMCGVIDGLLELQKPKKGEKTGQ